MAKVNFLNQAESFMSDATFLSLCQKATFCNFILKQIRKPENEGTLFWE